MRKWRNAGWMMPSLLAMLMPTAQAGEPEAAGQAVMVREDRHGATAAMADQALNRNWSAGNFEGTIADTGEQVLAALNSDKTAKWIVVFDRPAISEALTQRQVHLQQGQGQHSAATVAGVLRQEIAREQEKTLNMWQADNLITAVNAQFDMLINGAAVEATGEQIEEIAKQPGVASVHPDYVMQINLADSVPLIGAPAVWAMNDAGGQPVTGSGIRVAVIDTGIDYTHSAFGACSALNTGADCRVVGGYDFVNNDADPRDDNNHGTHVAGIIAGYDGAVTGVAPEASLYTYKVCSASGSCQTSHIIAALERAADPDGDGNPSDHVDAANLSLGGAGGPDDPLSVAVDKAVDAGISVVVSAGNSGSSYSTVGAPGAAAKAITVGASDKADKLASFSSRGPVTGYILKPDLTAPGVSINSSVRNGGYAKYDGTSMAAPHVAGAVALLKQLHPDWTPELLKAAVANSALDLSGLNPFAQGSGRLQLEEAAASSYLATPSSLSMGLVDNTVSVWSETQTLTVHNDADITQTISLSVSSGLPNGLTASLSQSSVTLAAGESQDVSFTVTVDNNVLPYPSAEPYSYSGKVLMDNGAEVRHVPFAVIKAAQLVLNWDVTPTFVLIHNRKSGGKQISFSSPTSPYYAMLPPDTYDIISWWSTGNYTVVNEDVALTGTTTKSISRAEAIHTVTFKLKDHTGAVQPAQGWTRDIGIWQPSTRKGFGVSTLSWGAEMPFDGFVSGMSDVYNYSMTGHHRHGTTNTFYVPAFAMQGVRADINVINDYDKAKLIDFTYNVLDSDLVRSYFIGAVPVLPPIPNLTTETWYLFSVSENAFFDNHSIILDKSDLTGWYAWGNHFRPTSSTSYTMWVRNYNPATNNHAEEQISYNDSSWQINGSPHYWAGNTKNTTSSVVIAPNSGAWGWNGKYIFVRSQWQDQSNVNANYDLLNSSGSSVRNGNLGSSHSQTITAPQGAYTLNTSYPGLLRGNPTAGTMTATFDTSKSDKNPPIIQELQIRENGERTDTVTDGAGQIAVRAADASTFTAEIAIDYGDGWQNLPVSASGAFQAANIPAFHPTEDKEASLRITLTDASGNKMVNTIAPAFIVKKSEAGWTLSVSSTGASGVAVSSSPADYSGTTDYSKPGIPDATEIILTAPAVSGGQSFLQWGGCDSTDTAKRTCTVKMLRDKAVTAHYTSAWTLSVNSAGAAGVAIAASPADYSGTTNYSKPGILNGTDIVLTAPAASGGRNFSGWSGCDSTDPAARTCTVSKMSADRTVTVNYVEPTWTLSVNSAGAAGVAIAASPADYSGTTNYSKPGILNGTDIVLTAPAASGGRNFSGWSGCDSTDPAARTCTVKMSADRTVTVQYVEPTWTLSVNSTGASGVAIAASPADYSGTTNYSKPGILNGTDIVLTAPAASGGRNFSGWSGCDESDPAARTCTVSNMSADRTVTVQYVEPTWTLSVNSAGAAGVAIASSPADYSGTTNYSKPGILNGTDIVLTAPAASGGRNFSGWSGCDSTDPAARTCTLNIASDRTVTVNYAAAPAEPRVLRVRSSGTSWVPILGSPSRYSGRTDYYRKNIPDGTVITLTAPDKRHGKYFSSWSGCDATDAAARSCTVTMSANKTVTANYARPKVLTVRSSGASWVPVSADPSQYSGRTDYRRNVRSNTSITLTAPEKARRWWFRWRTFSSWNGCDETDAAARTCTVNMSSNKRVTAVYR